MAAWSQVVLAADSKAGGHVSYQVGSTDVIASQFKNNGTLTGEDAGCESGDLVALAYYLDTPAPSVTFAIGLEQENALNWLSEPQTGYYQVTISGTGNVVDHFFPDAPFAMAEGNALDQKITDVGSKICCNYSDILESTVRQM